MHIAECDNLSVPRQNRRMSQVRMKDHARAKHRKELGKRLAVARGQVDPQEMAKYLGVPVNTYLSWERGRTTFPMHLVAAFCDKTHYPPGFIVTGIPNGDWNHRGTETGVFAPPKTDE